MTDMKHRSLTNDPPKVGDQLVVDGVKYRIRELTSQKTVYAKTSFGGQEVSVPLHELYWDPLPALWRATA